MPLTNPKLEAVIAGTQTASTGSVIFSNSNGISFGMSNSSVVTASYTVPTQSNQTQGFYAVGNTTGQSSSSTFDARTISFNGAGIASVGYSNGSVIISVPSGGGALTNINVSAGTTSNNLSNIVFSNSNNVSFGLNGSTITASITSQTNQTVGLYALGNTTQNSSTTLDARTMSFNALGAMTMGYSNGSIQVSAPVTSSLSATGAVSISVNGSTISIGAPNQTNQTIGFYGVGNTTQNSSTTLDARTLSFNGLGIVTVGFSNGSIDISATQSNQTAGLYAVGNTTGQSSSSTFDARTISFRGTGIASVGYSNGSVIISVPSGGGGITNINLSAGTTSNNLSAFVLSNSNNVSFGLNGSTVTATASFSQTNQTVGLYATGNTTQNSSTTLDARTLSFNALGAMTMGYSNGSIQVSAPVTSSLSATGMVSISVNGSTISIGVPNNNISQMLWPNFPWQTNFSISNASFSLQHFNAYNNMTASQANLLMALSGNTNSSGALTVSIGIYTLSGSTMSLASSVSRQITWTSGSQTSASSLYGGVSGTRYRTVSLNNWSLSAGDYVLGMWFRTTNNGTWRAFGQQGPTIVGAVDANETNHYFNGFSTSSFTTAMVGSINVTDTNYVRTGANALQQPGIIFLGSF